MVTFEQSYSVLRFIQLLVVHVAIYNTRTHAHTQRQKNVLNNYSRLSAEVTFDDWEILKELTLAVQTN